MDESPDHILLRPLTAGQLLGLMVFLFASEEGSQDVSW